MQNTLKQTTKWLLLAFVFIFTSFISIPTAFAAGGYTWNDYTSSTPLSGQWWSGLASSSSSKYLSAVYEDGDIYTSSNYGATWANDTANTPLSGLYWVNVTSSASGQYVTALAATGDIYTSSDYGAAWANDTANTPLSGSYWQKVSSSASGQYLIATTFHNNAGYIYTSSDYGATWAKQTNGSGGQGWIGAAISASGQYMASAGNGNIYTSSNFGATWNNSTANTPLSGLGFSGLSYSNSGQYLTAVVADHDIYTSSDYGATWANDTTNTALSGLDWQSTATSYSGQYLAAVAYGKDVYTSSDYGATWQDVSTISGTQNQSWSNIVMSASGQYLTAAGYSTDIYSGNNPTLAATSPGITNRTVNVTINGSTTVDVLNGISGYPDSSTLTIISGPSHGTAVDPPSTLTYTPNQGYRGSDSLTYQVCSSLDNSLCSQATLSFNISDIAATTEGAPDTGYGAPITTDSSNTLVSYGVGLASLLFIVFGVRKLAREE